MLYYLYLKKKEKRKKKQQQQNFIHLFSKQLFHKKLEIFLIKKIQ